MNSREGPSASENEGRIRLASPFGMLPEWVLTARKKDLSQTAKTLYALLWMRGGSDGSSHYRNSKLAEQLDCSKDTITTAKAQLVEFGAIKIEPQFRDDGGRSADDIVVLAHRGTPTEKTGWPPTEKTRRTPTEKTGGQELDLERNIRSEPEGSSRAPGEKLAKRKTDFSWDALVQATGADPNLERGKLNAALRVLRGHPDYKLAVEMHGAEGADKMLALEIPKVAELYRRRWPEVELTPTALARNFKRVRMGPKGAMTSAERKAQIAETQRREAEDAAKRSPDPHGLPAPALPARADGSGVERS